MEKHRKFLHDHHRKSIEDLKQALLYATMELKTTQAAALEELRRRDHQITILHQHLNRVIKERDEALLKSQKTHLQNNFRSHHMPPAPAPAPTTGDLLSGVSGLEDEQTPVPGKDQLSPICDESIASPKEDMLAVILVPRKPLPEKGKLLQAVMKAGPLLQTLLLAGPLPQWKHPPPPLGALEIPPAGIGGCESRGSSGSGVDGDGSSPTRPYKYQRVAA